VKLTDELMGVRFVGQGMIKQQGGGTLYLRVGENALCQAAREGVQLLLAMTAEDGLYVGAESALDFTHGLFLGVKGVREVKGVKDNTIDYTYVYSSSEARSLILALQ
jgi:hypothetical protein